MVNWVSIGISFLVTQKERVLMSYQQNPKGWHLLADRFIWYDDLKALTLIPDEISNEEVQQYLFTFHGDNISLEEIKKWREECV
jgi:hypothetical protein